MRCEAVSPGMDPASAIMPMIVAQTLQQPQTAVRCALDAGHEGEHQGWVCPFPGFPDSPFWWSSTPSQKCTKCGIGPFFYVSERDYPELCLDCAEHFLSKGR